MAALEFEIEIQNVDIGDIVALHFDQFSINHSFWQDRITEPEWQALSAADKQALTMEVSMLVVGRGHMTYQQFLALAPEQRARAITNLSSLVISQAIQDGRLTVEAAIALDDAARQRYEPQFYTIPVPPVLANLHANFFQVDQNNPHGIIVLQQPPPEHTAFLREQQAREAVEARWRVPAVFADVVNKIRLERDYSKFMQEFTRQRKAWGGQPGNPWRMDEYGVAHTPDETEKDLAAPSKVQQ